MAINLPCIYLIQFFTNQLPDLFQDMACICSPTFILGWHTGQIAAFLAQSPSTAVLRAVLGCQQVAAAAAMLTPPSWERRR